MRHPERRAAQIAFGIAALFGGCQCQVHSVSVSPPNCAPDGALVLGDSAYVEAQAWSSDQPAMFALMFGSYNRPDRFHWRVEPRALAVVTATSRVLALAVGSGTLNATADGVTGSAPLSIVPAQSRVQLRFVSTVGLADTLYVEFTAYDSLEQVIPPASLDQPYAPVHVRQSNSLQFVKFDRASGLATLVPRLAGTATFDWCYARRTGTAAVHIHN